MTRTFIAIELGEQARAYLAREVARLRRMLPAVRWADSAGIHLTLAFLGELDDAQVATVGEAVEIAAAVAQPFTLEVAGLGTFGPPTAPRVIWAGVAGDLPRLRALHAALAAALELRGFPRDERPFSPHMTLARPRTPPPREQMARLTQLVDYARARALPRSGSATIPVTHVSIMKSERLQLAARYTCLRVIRLGAARAGA